MQRAISERHPFPVLPRRSRARWRSETCEQNRKDAGEEDAVERARATNRGDRSAQAADLVEIEEIRANQRSHGAADIGQWRRVFAGKDKGEDCRGHGSAPT